MSLTATVCRATDVNSTPDEMQALVDYDSDAAQPASSIEFTDEPVYVICPKCGMANTTTVDIKVGVCNHVAAAGCCMIGCVLGCCLIPYHMECCSDWSHKCTNKTCGHEIATVSRITGKSQLSPI